MNAPAIVTLSAPERFAQWLASNSQLSKTDNRYYNYLPRSDSHSVAVCRFVVQDLVQRCETIRAKAAEGKIACGLNVKHTWPNGKTKALDFAIGIPKVSYESILPEGMANCSSFSRVLLSCEAKNCMTEHKKSQPRLFDELQSSHQIVHQGDDECIAAGLAVINIANTFVSPLRQRTGLPVEVTKHDQPRVTDSMLAHLRGLPIRTGVGQVGFDAFCALVVNCNNQNGATLHITTPAPQPGDAHHYDTFVARMEAAFKERFSDL